MFQKILRTLAGILLIPVAIGAGKAFCTSVAEISLFSGVLRLFERGVLVYLLIHVMVFRPIYLYVLGHEFVHVLATWFTGGKVMSFKVAPSGGNVVTSKTNFFIELSPYFVPIYTIAAGLVFMVLGMMGRQTASASSTFIFTVGFTMAFHFVMTSEVLRMEQPDIIKSGFIFSLVLIFVANLIVIMAVFSPIFSQLSFISFLKSSAANSWELYRTIYATSLEFVNKIRFW